MKRRTLTVRAVALMGAGSAAIHQLRYAIGYGSAAPHALAAHPHGYLAIVMPGVITALLIAVGSAVLRTAGAKFLTESDEHRRIRAKRHSRRSLLALALVCALALAAIYATQETLEGAGAVANGGWIGLALAIPAGFLVALALRGAEAAETLRSAAPQRVAALVAAVQTAHGAPQAPALRTRRPSPARGPPPAFVL